MRRVLGLVFALSVLCAASPESRAAAVYEYVGQTFTGFVDAQTPPGSYDASMRVTGSISLAAPVAPSSGGAPTLLAYSFSDGRQNLTEANSVPFFEVLTDAAGAFVEWELYLRENSDSGVIFTVKSSDGQGTLYIDDLGELGNVCSIAACQNPQVGDMGTRSSFDAADAGTWTLLPESGEIPALGPAALGVLVALLAGLGVVARRGGHGRSA